MFTSSFSFDQAITGTVTDDNNKPLPGTTILVRGIKRNTVSDNEGKCCNVPESKEKLVIGFAGCSIQGIAVKVKRGIGGLGNVSTRVFRDKYESSVPGTCSK